MAYDPQEYQRNKESYKVRQQRYKQKNKDIINEKQRVYRNNETSAERNARYSKTRRLKIRALYDEFMSDKSCEHCGYSDYRSLVWHHIDPSIKTNGVVQLINKGMGWKTIMNEVEKCQCLCHNCHNILHHHSS